MRDNKEEHKLEGLTPIYWLEFLDTFVKTCDENDVREGVALRLAPHHLSRQPLQKLHETQQTGRADHGGLSKWPQAVKKLFREYVNERRFNTCKI